MDFFEVLKKYDANQSIESSVIFIFRPSRLMMKVFWNLLFFPILFGISFFIYQSIQKSSYYSLNSTDQIIFIIVGIVCLIISLWLLVKLIIQFNYLIYSKKNVIIFTNQFVVKRLGKKVVGYFYERISNPYLYIKGSKEFAVEKISFSYDKKIVDFVKNRWFGSLEEIFQELNQWTKNDNHHQHIIATHGSDHY